jgi:hypothetical protein
MQPGRSLGSKDAIWDGFVPDEKPVGTIQREGDIIAVSQKP